MGPIADTPEPPYWAVIFTNVRTEGDDNGADGYDVTADRMVGLAADQPGFLGVESAREEVGITVSYWVDLDSIAAWKAHAEHLVAQQAGRDRWYASYVTRIAKVERDYRYEARQRASQ